MEKNARIHLAAGIILAAGCAVFLSCAGDTPAAIAFMSAAFVLLGLIRIDLSEKKKEATAWLLLPMAAVLGFFLTQSVMNLPLGDMLAYMPLVGVVISAALILFLTLLTGRVGLSACLALGGMLVIATADFYVYAFRGTELRPADVLAFQTAMNVAGEYRFGIAPTVARAWAFYGLFCFLVFRLRLGKLKLRARLVTAPLLALAGLATVIGLHGVKPQLWSNDGAMANGLIANLLVELRDSRPREPTGYDTERLLQYEDQLVQRGRTKGPTVIAIMNESFADLRRLGDGLNTNVDVMPFFDGLREDTIRGYALLSSFGGGTANSEYEFLTGNTIGFLPDGSIPYQQYVTDESYSLVSEFKSRGYYCLAMHPYYSNGWMRNIVYPALGFDEIYFMEAFPEGGTLRSFITDRVMFEKVVDTYESRSGDEPMFLFGVTVQNHGGYTYDGTDFKNTVSLRGMDGDYPDAEQYLSLIQESDAALEYLIEYFAGVEEDVVIVFFGDHYPALNEAFYEEIHGGGFEAPEERMLLYEVPFAIWANYDIPEQEIELTSLCFLSEYLFQAARLRPSAYSEMLGEIQDVIPALNILGYYSQQSHTFRSLEEAEGVEREALDLYRQLEYNNIFDSADRIEAFRKAQ